jgi:ATP-dependent RNA helicase DHX57
MGSLRLGASASRASLASLASCDTENTNDEDADDDDADALDADDVADDAAAAEMRARVEAELHLEAEEADVAAAGGFTFGGGNSGAEGGRVRPKGREEVAALRAASAAEAARLAAAAAATRAAADAADAVAAATRLSRAAAAAEAACAAAASSPAAATESARLLAALRARRADPGAAVMLAARAALPAASCAPALVAAIMQHQVVLIAGATGCGKTTQLPQFILDAAIDAGRGAAAHLLCTQPRRVAATSVAERVASERGERIGECIGYKIRLEATSTAATRVLYCTTGVALRRLVDDPALMGTSHVIVDEVHERSLDTDLLLALLRDVLPLRPSLRLVLMSATLDADAFASYFSLPKGAVVTVPGFTHPVRELYLEDVVAATGYAPQRGDEALRTSSDERKASSSGGAAPMRPADEAAALRAAGYSASVADTVTSLAQERTNYALLDALLGHICSQGAPGGILVFCSGLLEITKAYENAKANPLVRAATGNGTLLIALHSALGSAEQRAVFSPPPPGVRKIVIATNIAETSITIDDIVHVVDAGRVKQTGYEPSTRMALLEECWVSAASAAQRRGRAGRTRPGVCWRLYSRATFASFARHAPPEVLRVPLEGALLSATRIAPAAPGGAAALLRRLPSAPPPRAVTVAAEALRRLGAFDSRYALTPLGHHLAALPLDPRVGKMLIYAALLRCLGPALTIAAVLGGGRSPFVAPMEKRAEADAAKKAFAGTSASDHIAAAAAFDAWAAARKAGRRIESDFVRDSFVSGRAMEGVADARRQCASLLASAGFLGARSNGRNGRGGGGGGGRRDAPEDVGVDAVAWAAANEHSGDVRVLRAVLVAGLYPNLARVEAGSKPGAPPRLVCRAAAEYGEAAAPAEQQQQQRGGKGAGGKSSKRAAAVVDAPVALHPCSVAHGSSALPTRWLVFLEQVKTSGAFLRDVTPVSPYALLLFGGELRVGGAKGDEVRVDGWAAFRAPPRAAVLFGALRRRLDALLAEKVARPGADVAAASAQLVTALVALLASEPSAAASAAAAAPAMAPAAAAASGFRV